MFNSTNSYQGKTKKVLCVCSAGLLRSPTAAQIINQEYKYNTRAAGMEEDFALIPVDDVLLNWADEIVCMDSNQEAILLSYLGNKKPIQNLNIQDSYKYMDPKLVNLIKERYKP